MFDPFLDSETRGYLRNVFGEKEPEIIRRLEHDSFIGGVVEAFRNLSCRSVLSYDDVLATHKTLFIDMYHWAGQDRLQTAPDIAVSKGGTLFAHPADAKSAVEYALRLGQDRAVMSQRFGEVMGYLAYGHPFLDGNGRTIMVIHAELAQRAGFSIAWAATDKSGYLSALTRELNHPGRGTLDEYLRPFIQPAVGAERLASHVIGTKGLDGGLVRGEDDNTILGKVTDPALQARYEKHEQRAVAEAVKSATPKFQTCREQTAAQPQEATPEAAPEQKNKAKL